MKKFSFTIPILWGILLLLEFYVAIDFDLAVNRNQLLGLVLLILLFLIPLVVPLYKRKQGLRQEKAKILYRVPLDTAKVALVSSTIAVIAAVEADNFLNYGKGSEFLYYWLMLLGPSYVLITVGVSFLVSLCVYLWVKFVNISSQNYSENNDIKTEQAVKKTIDWNTILHILQQIVVAAILAYLAIFILRGTDFLHWLLG